MNAVNLRCGTLECLSLALATDDQDRRKPRPRAPAHADLGTRQVQEDDLPRNVEIKARLDGEGALAEVAARAAALGAEGPRIIEQDDTFFACANGRLKLRAFAGGAGELIFYRRADAAGPKESFYVLAPVADCGALREALTLACGQAGRVRKRRELWLAGRTRVHLDRVEGLGAFLELEVVLGPEEATEAGDEEARRLLSALGVAPAQLVEQAYVDLLRRAES